MKSCLSPALPQFEYFELQNQYGQLVSKNSKFSTLHLSASSLAMERFALATSMVIKWCLDTMQMEESCSLTYSRKRFYLVVLAQNLRYNWAMGICYGSFLKPWHSTAQKQTSLSTPLGMHPSIF